MHYWAWVLLVPLTLLAAPAVKAHRVAATGCQCQSAHPGVSKPCQFCQRAWPLRVRSAIKPLAPATRRPAPQLRHWISVPCGRKRRGVALGKLKKKAVRWVWLASRPWREAA